MKKMVKNVIFYKGTFLLQSKVFMMSGSKCERQIWFVCVKRITAWNKGLQQIWSVCKICVGLHPAPSLTGKSGTYPCSPVWNLPPLLRQNTDFSAQNDPFFAIKHWLFSPKRTPFFVVKHWLFSPNGHPFSQ